MCWRAERISRLGVEVGEVVSLIRVERLVHEEGSAILVQSILHTPHFSENVNLQQWCAVLAVRADPCPLLLEGPRSAQIFQRICKKSDYPSRVMCAGGRECRSQHMICLSAMCPGFGGPGADGRCKD